MTRFSLKQLSRVYASCVIAVVAYCVVDDLARTLADVNRDKWSDEIKQAWQEFREDKSVVSLSGLLFSLIPPVLVRLMMSVILFVSVSVGLLINKVNERAKVVK